jgi:cell wall-associated NlpC family hydrolase
VIAVQDLIGVGYEDAGRCWGLSVTLATRMGLCLPETPEAALADPKAFGVEISVPEAGTLVLMRNSFEDLAHVGLMLNSRYMAHATRETGVRVEELARLGPQLEIRRYIRLEPARAQA